MKKSFSLLYLLSLACLSAMAQAGSPDNTFGTNGRVNIPMGVFDDFANAVAIQADGKIVVAGFSRITEINNGNRHDFSVARLNTNGSLDNTFDADGKVIIPVGDFGGFANAVRIPSDGKILVAGTAIDNDKQDFVVVRLNADGSLDNTFDADGRVYISIGMGDDICSAMALQPDNKIVLAGQTDIDFSNIGFSAVRLNSDGTLDLNFDADGKRFIPVNGTTNDAASSIAIQPDGNIILAGTSRISSTRHFSVVRLTPTGANDPGFGSNGETVLVTSNSSFCRAIALQPDGKILLAGGTVETTNGFQVVRLSGNGDLDNSFDTDGRVFVPVGTGVDDAYAIALQSDGKIVVAGQANDGNGMKFSIIRLNTSGTLDACFDQDGKAMLPSTTAGSFGERCRAIGLQSDGKIVLAGVNGNFNTIPTDPAIDFIVMRINGGGSGSDQDLDGDGYNSCVDCDDSNPAVHPGATEVCNGIDDNCNGQVDEGVTSTFYRDADGDGFGNPNNTLQACTAPVGYVTDNTDCDDSKLLYADNDGDGFGAGSPIACGVADNTDCNDANSSIHATVTYYRDADGDGFGDAAVATSVCQLTPPTGYVSNSQDCDDTKLLYADNDGDGFGAGSPVACGVPNNTDCNDANSNIHAVVTYYRDADGDGFGNAAVTTSVCQLTPPTGYVSNSQDCDDTKLLYADNDGDGFGAGSPAACGVANNTDCNDANSNIHAVVTYYRDADGDGFGNAAVTTSVCQLTPPTGYVSNSQDCDDTKLLYADNDGDGFGTGSPVACGVANNTDCNDANSSIHAAVTYYRDADGDGFGNAAVTTSVCQLSPPAGYVSNSQDCDDTKLLYADNDGDGFGTGSPVACGAANNTDCNDANSSIHAAVTYYRDADGDGFGNAAVTTSVCQLSPPAGYVSNSQDCNDGNANINPGKTEVCGNNVDDNCSGQIDEGCPTTAALSINDVSVYESQHNAILTISLSQPIANDLKINYKTIDGTANKKDYKSTTGTVTIAAGSLGAPVTIGIISDNVNENTEFFDVQISLPKIKGQTQMVPITDDMGRVTILDGVAPLTKAVLKNNVSAGEGDSDGFDVAVSPNPTNSGFTLRIESSSMEPADVRVFDVEGKLVKKLKATSHNLRLGNELRSGVYIIEVQQHGYTKTVKLIKF